MNGWIKLHRCLLDNPIWSQSKVEQKAVLITLLLMANHAKKEWIWEGKKFMAEPGQFVTSLKSLSLTSGVSIQSVKTGLANFEKLGFLTNKSTKTGRLITIVNWGLYQQRDDATNKDTNKEVTKDQQRGNKEVTPNKNDKNLECENVRKEHKHRDDLVSQFFEEFWEFYPRKEAKKDAEKAFRKIFPHNVPDEQCTVRLQNLGACVTALKREGRERKHIPLPATLLNREDFDVPFVIEDDCEGEWVDVVEGEA